MMARACRIGRIVALALAALVVWSAPARALDERSEPKGIEIHAGPVTIGGSGRLKQDSLRLRGRLRWRPVDASPLFLASQVRFTSETRLPYDLRHWGGQMGLGWSLSEATDVLLSYRLDSYKVFNTGTNVDPIFRSNAGRTEVTALGIGVEHDTRDESAYPTQGLRARLGAELAGEWLGGEYDLARLDGALSTYATPWRGRGLGWFDEVTLVEHLKLGWVESYGETEDVPFFERYFVGGTQSIRGHRDRWLTPRGLEQQFVGGEIQVINNVEARIPVLPDALKRRLSAAVFFDAGRAYRRFSDVGDFGYGAGAGLRYVIRLWQLKAVARADYGVSFDHEGDDSTARLHLGLGLPF